MKSFRQKELIEMLTPKGVITSVDAALHFGVSIETIRRDLDPLENKAFSRKLMVVPT